MSVIDNPIVTLNSGDTVHIATQAEFENCLTQFLGEAMVERYRDIAYDIEVGEISSDLDAYESDLDAYHNLLDELLDMVKEAKQAKNKMVVLNKIEDKITRWL